jgi:hypothetical protein
MPPVSVLCAPAAAVDDDREPESCGRGGFVGRLHDALGHERDAVGEEQLARRRRIQPDVVGGLERALDDRVPGVTVDPLERRDRALGAP